MTAMGFYLIAKGIALLLLAAGIFFAGGGIYNCLTKAGEGVQRLTMTIRDAINAHARESIKAQKEFRKSRRRHTVIDNRELFDAISGFGVRTQLYYVEGWLEDSGDRMNFDTEVPKGSFPLVVNIEENKNGGVFYVNAIFVTVLGEEEPKTEIPPTGETQEDEHVPQATLFTTT